MALVQGSMITGKIEPNGKSTTAIQQEIVSINTSTVTEYLYKIKRHWSLLHALYKNLVEVCQGK